MWVHLKELDDDRQEIDFFTFKNHPQFNFEPLAALLRGGIAIPIFRLRNFKSKILFSLNSPAFGFQLREKIPGKLEPAYWIFQDKVLSGFSEVMFIDMR